MRLLRGQPVEVALCRALALVLAAHIAIAVVIAGALLANGDSFAKAVGATAPSYAARFALPMSQDSWRPMLYAYQQARDDASADYYAATQREGLKFQYPPSALLVFDLLPERLRQLDALEPGGALNSLLSNISRLAILLTIAASIAILWLGLTRPSTAHGTAPLAAAPGTFSRFVLFSLIAALALTFHPLMAAYALGQVQTLLNCALSIALLLYLLGRKAAAGICVGICCLFKPQYGLVLLWALLCRQHRFAIGMFATVLVGELIALARFGLDDHLRYVSLLMDIAKRGEAYWMNQSVNGIANYLASNGDPREFNVWSYAPHHPAVRIATSLSSLAILAAAFYPWRRSPVRAEALGLAAVLLAVTMASPIAWEHHYGVMFAIFAVTLGWLIRERQASASVAWLLALAYLAVAGTMQRPNLIFDNGFGLLGFHLFAGALAVLLLLARLINEPRSQ